MIIDKVGVFLLHVPVTGNRIADSTHQVTHWGVPGVIIETDTGLQGYGYTGTHGHLATDRLIVDAIAGTYAQLLKGENAHDVLHIWRKLDRHPPAQWVGRSGILKLALSAIDVALWDLKAKAAGLPLWRLLGGAHPQGIAAYNTNCGWLSLPLPEMVDGCLRLVTDEGWNGVKVKIGSPNPRTDFHRLEAVRRALGPDVRIMVDANGALDLPRALEYRRCLRDLDVVWFEEPVWYDDVAGHARLAQAVETPLALGEQLYTVDAFRDFITAGAVHYVQPDAVRLGGVSEWWQVADLALCHRLPVVPHVGDMVQIHWHLALAHPACTILEYIPWLKECFEEPAAVREGRFLPPRMPGAATTLRPDALERFGVDFSADTRVR
jgi:L-alanine-DL-glutamate epimerase-like enolase superfamily enzyme